MSVGSGQFAVCILSRTVAARVLRWLGTLIESNLESNDGTECESMWRSSEYGIHVATLD